MNKNQSIVRFTQGFTTKEEKVITNTPRIRAEQLSFAQAEKEKERAERSSATLPLSPTHAWQCLLDAEADDGHDDNE